MKKIAMCLIMLLYSSACYAQEEVAVVNNAYNSTILYAILGLMGLIVIFSLVKTFRGAATFFSSYLDLFVGLLPLIVLVVWFIAKSESLTEDTISGLTIGACGISFIYNFFRAFQLNREHKFLAFCIGLTRMILVNIIPILMVLVYFMHRVERGKEESSSEFQSRQLATDLQRFAMVGGLGGILYALVRKPQKQHPSFQEAPIIEEDDVAAPIDMSAGDEEERRRFEDEMANPDMRPNAFDNTFEAWLIRIGLWGKVEVVHSDPESRGKRKVGEREFLRRISDVELANIFGKWEIEKTAVNKIEFIRSYDGLNGKRLQEKFVVSIKLKPELKKSLGWFA